MRGAAPSRSAGSPLAGPSPGPSRSLRSPCAVPRRSSKPKSRPPGPGPSAPGRRSRRPPAGTAPASPWLRHPASPWLRHPAARGPRPQHPRPQRPRPQRPRWASTPPCLSAPWLSVPWLSAPWLSAPPSGGPHRGVPCAPAGATRPAPRTLRPASPTPPRGGPPVAPPRTPVRTGTARRCRTRNVPRVHGGTRVPPGPGTPRQVPTWPGPGLPCGQVTHRDDALAVGARAGRRGRGVPSAGSPGPPGGRRAMSRIVASGDHAASIPGRVRRVTRHGLWPGVRSGTLCGMRVVMSTHRTGVALGAAPDPLVAAPARRVAWRDAAACSTPRGGRRTVCPTGTPSRWNMPEALVGVTVRQPCCATRDSRSVIPAPAVVLAMQKMATIVAYVRREPKCPPVRMV